MQTAIAIPLRIPSTFHRATNVALPALSTTYPSMPKVYVPEASSALPLESVNRTVTEADPCAFVVTWTYVGWMLISTVGAVFTVQTTFEGVPDLGLSTENGQPVNVSVVCAAHPASFAWICALTSAPTESFSVTANFGGVSIRS